MNSRDTAERKNAERIFARGFTVLGGVFWIGAAFAGPYVYGGKSAVQAMLGQGIYPLIFTIGVLALGWFYERFAALILALGAVGTVAWGLIMGWDPFVWGIMLAFFVTPTVVSAVLFYLAGNAPGEVDEAADKAGVAV
jgi:hypothetical protein